MSPRRGEVWLVSLGAGQTEEPGKNRPAVVVSADQLNSEAPEDLIVVVPLSSARAPSALRPEITGVEGVDHPSRAICRGVRAVARSRLLRPLGELPPAVVADIDRALALVLRLNAGGEARFGPKLTHAEAG